MENNLVQSFSNVDFNVRVVMRDDTPWFVAKDVASCIEHKDVSTMCKLCRDKDKVVVRANDLTSAGLTDVKNREYTLISESGLYRILAKCNLPKCEPFETYVFDEVLPSIRKTGGYSVAQKFPIPETFEDALILAGQQMKLAKEQERLRLQAEAERDEAIKTKTLYQEGLAAEMSGRVGGLTKANLALKAENESLKDAVGRGGLWRTVSMMKSEWIREFGHAPVWQKLKQFSADVKIEPVRDVEEKLVLANGTEKITLSYRYHREAWARYRKYEENLRTTEAEIENC